MTQRRTVLCIFGTRPEAIKMVPVMRALRNSGWAPCIVVVTAQHRDLLDQIGIAVDYDLNIMQPKQNLDNVLARMLPELENIIQTERPYAVLGQGGTVMATEHPEPVAEGVAQLVGTEQAAIVQQATRLLNDPAHYQSMARVCMPFGDGRLGSS